MRARTPSYCFSISPEGDPPLDDRERGRAAPLSRATGPSRSEAALSSHPPPSRGARRGGPSAIPGRPVLVALRAFPRRAPQSRRADGRAPRHAPPGGEGRRGAIRRAVTLAVLRAARPARPRASATTGHQRGLRFRGREPRRGAVRSGDVTSALRSILPSHRLPVVGAGSSHPPPLPRPGTTGTQEGGGARPSSQRPLRPLRGRIPFARDLPVDDPPTEVGGRDGASRRTPERDVLRLIP